MSTIYILILLYLTGSGDGQAAMTSAEFNDQAGCQVAAQLAKQKFEGLDRGKVYWVCTRK